MRVFLIGFMGCGKSTLGAKLAARLRYPFIDLDKKIEAETGISISQYFKESGESAFRELEKNVLQHSILPENVVIATGGGTPCFFDNIEWMNKNGLTIYISVPSGVLAHRLKHSKTQRPLIVGKTEKEVSDFIAEKLKQREPFYNQAQYIIEGPNITVEKIISAIPQLKY